MCKTEKYGEYILELNDLKWLKMFKQNTHKQQIRFEFFPLERRPRMHLTLNYSLLCVDLR